MKSREAAVFFFRIGGALRCLLLGARERPFRAWWRGRSDQQEVGARHSATRVGAGRDPAPTGLLLARLCQLGVVDLVGRALTDDDLLHFTCLVTAFHEEAQVDIGADDRRDEAGVA